MTEFLLELEQFSISADNYESEMSLIFIMNKIIQK